MSKKLWSLQNATFLSVALALAGCGGGGGGTNPVSGVTPPAVAINTFTVGGTVTGLAAGSSLQLQNNGTATLPVPGAGTFAFVSQVSSGSRYSVSVQTQPTGQFCNVMNSSGVVAVANITSVTVACAKTFAGGTGTVTANGGTVSTPAADVTAPVAASLKTQTVTVTNVAPPPGLPVALTPVGAAIDVAIDKPAMLNAPLSVTLRYDATAVPNEDLLAVVHYDTTNRRYEPVTILNQNKTTHSFEIESRTFSPFLIVSFSTQSPTNYSVPNFEPSTKGWNIDNFGDYFSPGGNCLGMAGYATWYFANRSDNLNSKFSTVGDPSIAKLVATRAFQSQSQYWATKSNTVLNALGAAKTAQLMKMYMSVFEQPLILLLGTDGQPKHASVLYGYDANSNFQFYDVNVKNAKQTFSFDGTKFGTYQGFNSFSFATVPSLGRTEDFAQLTSEAEGGFTNSSIISITAPTQGQQIAGHSANITGTLSASLNANSSLVAYVKGPTPQLIPVTNNAFSSTIPISSGGNTIILFAGVDVNNQSNWFPNAATKIINVTGTSTLSSLLTTLTWDQDLSDVDLYVTEPSPSNQTAWYNNRSTSNQMKLDFDNTVGYGPEHTTLAAVGTAAGAALPGQYVIRVHYFSDRGAASQTVSGRVSIVVNEGKPNQRLETKTFTISVSNSANSSPGSSGPDWVNIGTVDLFAGTITLSP